MKITKLIPPKYHNLKQNRWLIPFLILDLISALLVIASFLAWLFYPLFPLPWVRFLISTGMGCMLGSFFYSFYRKDYFDGFLDGTRKAEGNADFYGDEIANAISDQLHRAGFQNHVVYKRSRES